VRTSDTNTPKLARRRISENRRYITNPSQITLYREIHTAAGRSLPRRREHLILPQETRRCDFMRIPSQRLPTTRHNLERHGSIAESGDGALTNGRLHIGGDQRVGGGAQPGVDMAGNEAGRGLFAEAVFKDGAVLAGRGLEEGVGWLRRAAERRHVYAGLVMDRMLTNTGRSPSEVAEGVQWARKAAMLGSPRGMTAWGDMLGEGCGVELDEKAGAGWCRKAAARGDAMGMCGLGVCMMTDTGVRMGQVQAVDWYRQAAARGDTRAMH
jgi:hypothetical protein